MHVSNPIGEMKIVEGSRFVNEMGRMAKKYMDEKIHTINRKKIVVEGINAVSYTHLTLPTTPYV